MEILTKEEKVLKYINRKNRVKSTLIFKETGSNFYIKKGTLTSEFPERKVDEFKDLFDLIIKLFKLSKICASVNINTGRLETTAGRRRSVFDIWRHVKYYLPEITIFEIMREIFKNKESFIIGYCSTIRRIVLCYYGEGSSRYFVNFIDEYGNRIRDWENIGLTKEITGEEIK